MTTPGSPKSIDRKGKGPDKVKGKGKNKGQGKNKSRNDAEAQGDEIGRKALVTNFDDHLNRSLDDVIRLLEREITRLKESLEAYRLSEHPQRAEIVRWHVRTLDERQDALEDLQVLIMAKQEDSGPR